MRAAIILVITFISSFAFAQLNESDTMRFQLRTSITGTLQKGNVEMFVAKGKADMSLMAKKKWVFKTQNSLLYQEFFKRKADNDFFSRNYIYFQPQKVVYPYAIAYISTNFRRKIDYRYFAGFGGTVQAIRKENHMLKFAVNAVYESTIFKGSSYNFSEYDNSNYINIWRSTIYMSGWHYLFNNHLRIIYNAYWQPSFTRFNNYRTQFDMGADFPVWKGLAFNVLYTFTHENVVIKKIKQDDGLLTFGLSYQFKKL